jgi:hypothetical protein
MLNKQRERGNAHFATLNNQCSTSNEKGKCSIHNTQQSMLNKQREGEMLNPQHSTINAQQESRPLPVSPFSSIAR